MASEMEDTNAALSRYYTRCSSLVRRASLDSQLGNVAANGASTVHGKTIIGNVVVRKRKRGDDEELMLYNVFCLLDSKLAEPRDNVFVLIKFTSYCFSDLNYEQMYVPAEVGMTAFSLRRGIFDNYASLIDPESFPIGTAADSRASIAKHGIPSPPFSEECMNYKKILRDIENFMNRYTTFNGETTILFCVRDDIEEVEGCLRWLCVNAGFDEKPFTVYPYGLLLQHMTNIGREMYLRKLLDTLDDGEMLRLEDPKGINNGRYMTRRIPHTARHIIGNMSAPKRDTTPVYHSYRGLLRNMASVAFYEDDSRFSQATGNTDPEKYKDSHVFMFEALADEFLKSNDLDIPEMGCPHHMVNSNKVRLCPLSITNRQAYNSLDILVRYWSIIPIEGYHYPMRNSEAEKRKRLAMLANRGVYGYKGLYGFANSMDSRFDETNFEDELQDELDLANLPILTDDVAKEEIPAENPQTQANLKYFFDSTMRTVGRGVRIPLKEEDSASYIRRQKLSFLLRKFKDEEDCYISDTTDQSMYEEYEYE